MEIIEMGTQPHYGTNNGTETSRVVNGLCGGWRASRLPSLEVRSSTQWAERE